MPLQQSPLSLPLKVLLVGYGPMALALGYKLSFLKDTIDFLGQIILPDSAAAEVSPWNTWVFPSINHYESHMRLMALQPQLILVASWPEKLQPHTLNIPGLGFINVHGSLLPRHRGPNPYIAALLSNDRETGVTFHWMDSGWDTGPLAWQVQVPILPADTGGDLQKRAAQIAQETLPEVLQRFIEGTLPALPQAQEEGNYFRIEPSLTQVDWSLPPPDILKHQQALSPWFMPCGQLGKRVARFKHLQTVTSTKDAPPGTILKRQGSVLTVSTGHPHQSLETQTQLPPGSPLDFWHLRPGLRFAPWPVVQ